MAPTLGTRIGPYELGVLLGAGGMGEVYRARDTKLGRDVAIKVLSPAFAGDIDRVMRAAREGKALASLNHPNIASIYGLEESAAGPAIVMELVEGEDLAARVARGAMPIAEALSVARQLVDALDAAHGRGVVHRDLKPANVKIRPDGTAKILDFGLAKAVDTNGDSTSAATRTSPAATAMGVILGTPRYMSPEQARGGPVDRRADLWAFGVILFEMLTGRKAFSGDSSADVIAAVVMQEPAWDALPRDTPPSVRRLLRRLLQKDPARRLHDAADARLDLDDAIGGGDSASGGTRAETRAGGAAGTWLWRAAALVVGAVAGAATVWQLTPRPADPPVRRFSISTPDGASAIRAVISPDGRAVAFATREHAWVQRLDQRTAVEIPAAARTTELFWSPDSTEVGYPANGRLWRTKPGDKPIDIGALPGDIIVFGERALGGGFSAAWLSGDRIWFTFGNSTTGLFEISARGGTAKQILEADGIGFKFISALPDRNSVVFVTGRDAPPAATRWLELFDGARRTRVFEPDYPFLEAWYSATGHLLLTRGGELWAVKFSLARRRTEGDPFLVAAGVTDGVSRATDSEDGTLVVLPSATSDDAQLTWVSRGGAIDGVLGRGPIPLRGVRLSPDGQSAVTTIAEGGKPDLYLVDVKTGVDRRLTFDLDPVGRGAPTWSPDGKFIVYGCDSGICSRRADGLGQRVVLVPGNVTFPSVSPDGRYLLFRQWQEATGGDVHFARMGPAGFAAPLVEAPRPLITLPGDERAVEVSPDGTLAAYESAEKDGWQIFLTTFPAGEGRWQVSRTVGSTPRWSRSGDRLFFRGVDSIVEARISRGPTPHIGALTTVASGAMLRTTYISSFDRWLDGSKFLVVRPPASVEENFGKIWIVEQWAREFGGK